ncbi:hypothetical protein BHE74_00035197 [Ensete ventricosum]|nr:hypothetical protein BHE74_00035197 [Ensete ventricosum]RZR94810.1 hypothetical protein BHM03_00023571 [Ensete ventricosum]
MHRVDTVGDLLGVRWELVEGIGSLPGWHKGVRQKKIETHRKIVGGSRKACQELGWSRNRYNGLRSSLSIRLGFGRCGGFRREFTRIFVEGIEKLAGNTPGDHLGEDQKTCHKYAGGYRIGEKGLDAGAFAQHWAPAIADPGASPTLSDRSWLPVAAPRKQRMNRNKPRSGLKILFCLTHK